MIVGYARTSTDEQKAGLEGQLKELQSHNCERIYEEEASSVGKRPKLEALLDFVREGDMLVVTKVDRLARSVIHLNELVNILQKKKCDIKILNLGVDTTTATGKLMLNMLGSIAQWEREMMLERQKIGIAKAHAEGAYKGRVPTARRQSQQVIELKAQGKRVPEIMAALKMSRASVYRIIQENTEA